VRRAAASRFALEPAQRLGPGFRLELGLLDQLYRQGPLQHRVPAFQHGSHAALYRGHRAPRTLPMVLGMFIGLRDESGSRAHAASACGWTLHREEH
jgi:hypothetical protein